MPIAMKITFDDQGLINRLRQFPAEQNAALELGIADVAETVRARAVENAPVSEGQLRKSISVVQTGATAIVGPNVSYAAPVEFVTQSRYAC